MKEKQKKDFYIKTLPDGSKVICVPKRKNGMRIEVEINKELVKEIFGLKE